VSPDHSTWLDDHIAWLIERGWWPTPQPRRHSPRMRLTAVGTLAVLAFVSGLAMPRAFSVRVGSLASQCQGITANTAGGPDGAGGCWPGAWNTGPNAPSGSMATYSGSCTITAANVTIDSKVVNCSPRCS
jgi:hypothetical protein